MKHLKDTNTPWIWIILLFLGAILVYLNGMTAFFIGDDFDYFLLLERARNLTDSFRMVFWGEWEPLVYFTYALDYRSWKHNPIGYNSFNMVVNSLLCVCLFLVVKTLTNNNFFPAMVTATFFAVHPIHDETIFYMAARGHILATFFICISLYFYCKVSHGFNWINIIAIFITTLLAAASKESAFLIPVFGLAMLGLAGPGEQTRGKWVMLSGITLLSSLAAILVLLWVRNTYIHLPADKLKGLMTFFKTGSLEQLISWKHFLYISYYTLMGVLPVPFAHMSFPWIQKFYYFGWILFIILALGLIPATWYSIKNSSNMGKLYTLGFIIFLFSILPTMAPSLSLRRRYLFMPSLGLSMMVGCITWKTYLILEHKVLLKKIFITILIILFITMTWVTLIRNRIQVQSGDVARNAIITFRKMIDRKSPPLILLVTLPRSYGGDFLAGAYLFHHSDIRSCLRYFVRRSLRVEYLFKTDFGHDFVSKTEPTPDGNFIYFVQYKNKHNFLNDNLARKKINRKKYPVAIDTISPDISSLSITVKLINELGKNMNRYLYLVGYSGERFYRIQAP